MTQLLEGALQEERAAVCAAGPTKETELVGLAFSGGGIRSATFNLGVLEALKKLNLLERIDYLSTVSGGGYIGAWLSANRTRDRKWLQRTSSWGLSIDHLRRYSNYLSPSVGLFSADTWAMATVWLRNTLLVQTTVVLAIASVLLVPRLTFPVFVSWHDAGHWRWITVVLYIAGVVGIAGNQLRVNREGKDSWFLQSAHWKSGLLLAGASTLGAFLIAGLSGFDPFPVKELLRVHEPWWGVPIAILSLIIGFCLLPFGAKLVGERRINYGQGWVQLVIVIPMMIASLLVAAVMWGDVQPGRPLSKLNSYSEFLLGAWRHWPFPLTVVQMSLLLFAIVGVKRLRSGYGAVAVVLASLLPMLALYALFCGLFLLLSQWAPMGAEGAWRAYVWGPAVLVVAYSLAIVLLIGMHGRQSGEGAREWWSRLGAWLAIYAVAWLTVLIASVYGPYGVGQLLDWKWTLGAGWLGSTLAGLLAGRSGATDGKDANKSTRAQITEIVAQVMPYIFIAGLLAGVAAAAHAVIWLNTAADILCATYWNQLSMMAASSSHVTWIVFGATVSLLVLFCARVDINEFSLNAFYRSRLVRCYLGATRPAKARSETAQRFTNFDDADDIRLAAVRDATTGGVQRPFHIVNCALNLGGSTDLALHTRHSANFTMTPLFCGSSYRDVGGYDVGYHETARYGGEAQQPTLGQAMSVSGAAASPNMGYHTSPVVAFLLTLFNVRLGWWFPQPGTTAAEVPSPWFSLRYLVAELFGLANERSRYLAVSDGGHFENLAAYELIRRRCKVVIVCDAECDPDMKFEGLGRLIRMCEVDFGYRIDIDVRPFERDASGWSSRRCAVGSIDYGDEFKGVLVYLKAAMNGHEPTGIQQYKAAHSTFPHETTGDQFYGEDQFESYRQLGREIANATFALAVAEPDFVRKAEMLVDIWSPTSRTTQPFTDSNIRLMELWSDLGRRADLKFLDPQLSPGWPDEPADNFRQGFYVGSQLLQLMENTYVELRLDETWSHPDHKGWQGLFKLWARSAVVREAWKRTNQSYGTRFRYFCARELDLEITLP